MARSRRSSKCAMKVATPRNSPLINFMGIFRPCAYVGIFFVLLAGTFNTFGIRAKHLVFLLIVAAFPLLKRGSFFARS